VTEAAGGTDLPDLRIVPLADLVLHEEADERRVAALERRLAADMILRNPPIVAPMPDGRFVVLDGANRCSALLQMGLPDLIVQVVDYDQVALSTWYHLVVGCEPASMLQSMREVSGLAVEPTDLATARQDLSDHRSLAYVVTPDGAVHSLMTARRDWVGAATLLRRAVATYKGQAHIHRIQSEDMDELKELYSEIAGLVVFPSYRPADILAMARKAAKLPSGITRHVIPRRALRLNLPLDVLWADTNRAEKNRWLAEWIRGRLQAGHVRFYEEPTVLFDE
jgi:hypothetical protein